MTQWLPFSMDIALAVMPFFYYGHKLNIENMEKKPVKKMILWGIVWIVSLLIMFPDFMNWTYLELAGRRYNFFPVCYLTAMAGTLCLSEFSIICCHFSIISKAIKCIGKNSIYLLCIHILDQIWIKYWFVEGRQYLSSIKRIVIDIAIFALFMSFLHIFNKIKKFGHIIPKKIQEININR